MRVLGDTPRAAGEIEQPALARDTRPFDEILQQCFGIGNAIAQIVGGRASEGIARKVRLDTCNAVHALSFLLLQP
jgi:hypothetical protein